MAQRQFRSDDTSPWLYGFGDGSDGALTISSNTTESPIDSTCTGTSGTNTLTVGTSLSFAAGQLVLIHQTFSGFGSATAGNWEIAKVQGYSGSTLTLTQNLVNEYSTSGSSRYAQVRVLKQYSSVTINSGVTYSAKAWSQASGVGGIMAFFCNGTVDIQGTISVAGNNASGTTPGTGIGWAGGPNEEPAGVGSQTGEQGDSSVATGGNSTAANGESGGGGTENGGNAGGGGGGHAISGGGGFATGSSTAGSGGGTIGTAGLTTLFFGGAGGGGAGQTGSVGGAGGAGAGICVIFGRTITVSGSINANGGNGSTSAIGGGGGAGGSVLLKGISLTLGTNLVTAAAGTQGTSGGVGGYGRIHVDYASAVSGSNTNPSFDSRQDSTLLGVQGAALVMLLF